jgi:acyl-CoA thioesterase-1
MFPATIPGRLSPLLLAATLTFAGCSGGAPAPVPAAGQVDNLDPTAPVAADMIGVVVLGDSITAGLGLLIEESFPSRLQTLFMEEGYHEVEIMNAGVSGDTTAGGLRRVDALITPEVKVAIVALGGNDALRGLSVADTKRNLAGIIDKFLEAGVSVLLTGMEGPTNLGEDYRSSFRNAYRELADTYAGRIRFVPFLLEGVGGDPALNQPDGIHPNAEGAQKIAELLYPTVRDLVDEIPTGPVF